MSKRKPVNKEKPELMPFNMGELFGVEAALPVSPNRHAELLELYKKVFRLKRDMLALELDLRKFYGDYFCTVKRNVPEALTPYVSQNDHLMCYLINACSDSIEALNYALETRMLQVL